MLDAYIIEEIKKQEEERRRRSESARPRLQIEIPPAEDDRAPPEDHPEQDPPEGESAVIHIDL